MKIHKYKKKSILLKAIFFIPLIGSAMLSFLLTACIAFIKKNNFSVSKIFGINLGFILLSFILCIINDIYLKHNSNTMISNIKHKEILCQYGNHKIQHANDLYWITCAITITSFFATTLTIAIVQNELHLDNRVVNCIIGISISGFILAFPCFIVPFIENLIENLVYFIYKYCPDKKIPSIRIANFFIPPVALVCSMCVAVFCKSSLIACVSAALSAFIGPFFILRCLSNLAEKHIMTKNELDKLHDYRIYNMYCITVLCSIIGIMASASLHQKGIMTNTAFTNIVITLSVIGICTACFIVKQAFSHAMIGINTEAFFENHEQVIAPE